MCGVVSSGGVSAEVEAMDARGGMAVEVGLWALVAGEGATPGAPEAEGRDCGWTVPDGGLPYVASARMSKTEVPGVSSSSAALGLFGSLRLVRTMRFGAPPEPMTSGNRIS